MLRELDLWNLRWRSHSISETSENRIVPQRPARPGSPQQVNKQPWQFEGGVRWLEVGHDDKAAARPALYLTVGQHISRYVDVTIRKV